MELTTLFEQVSGSDEFKEEYEELEKDKRRAEEDQIYSYQKKKGLAQVRVVSPPSFSAVSEHGGFSV